ncbi:pyridoxal phosphate-dependent aminotransferase [Echinicola strongylocentroti]|uniref:Pyridoxal phosphate-dependent aminotransferase n=1 Tax=Echinicola strongylocentroti TaxID=1795355 RepID=A0A2Z4IHG6_9BACT|nr:aminotransferase class I/II-fold pyridoxal phosphate-dependent enzyme [Echinicola strongylocentroti]AWW29863.1 pyridoxal phosphate-dependent aminotransferase [Echinicola strongylocentroti]
MGIIKLSEPDFKEDISGQVLDALDRKQVGYVGTYVDKFKDSLKQYLEITNLGLYSSGTASIHLALMLAGVNEGDEVICQSLTFAASVNPVRYLGAKPVFVGSETDTWNMCPRSLEAALEHRKRLGKRVKAIIPVHVFGMPAKMDAINEIANHYNVPVVEDAAEALGANINGRFCGTMGDYGIFSFNANKIITSGGGGALWAKRPEEINHADFLALQAKDPAIHYEHSQVGYNYAFSNLNAILGCSQFEQLHKKLAKRRENYAHYYAQLASYGLGFQEGEQLMDSNRWLTAVVFPKEEHVRELGRFLLANEVETRPIWKPMHLQPLYKELPYYGERVEEHLFFNGICLPSGSGLTIDQLAEVTFAVTKFCKKNKIDVSRSC